MPRHLPVLQTAAAEDEVAASRPRWHWVLIGAGLTVTLWAPLVAAAAPLGLRVAAHLVGLPLDDLARPGAHLSSRQSSTLGVSVAGALLLSFLVAAFGAGALVGRFGGRAGPGQAALGAALAAGLSTTLGVVMRTDLSATTAGLALLLLAVTGSLGGGLGGIFGFRKRPC